MTEPKQTAPRGPWDAIKLRNSQKPQKEEKVKMVKKKQWLDISQF